MNLLSQVHSAAAPLAVMKFAVVRRVVAHSIVQKVLDSHSHIIKQSRQVVGMFKDRQVKATHCFGLLDIEHFFMSGRSFELAKLVSSLFDDDLKLKSFMYDAIGFLLENQYVKDHVL